MSLILEALKKSEANRRLGQAPDLGTPFTPVQRGRSPLWALLVIVLSLCVGLWWWFGRGTPTTPAAPQPSNATAQAPGRTAAPAQHREALQQEDRHIFNRAQHRDAIAQTSAAAGRDGQIRLTAQRRDAMERMAKRPLFQAPGSIAQTPPAPVRVAEPRRAPQTADVRSYTSPTQPHPEAGQPQRGGRATAPGSRATTSGSRATTSGSRATTSGSRATTSGSRATTSGSRATHIRKPGNHIRRPGNHIRRLRLHNLSRARRSSTCRRITTCRSPCARRCRSSA